MKGRTRALPAPLFAAGVLALGACRATRERAAPPPAPLFPDVVARGPLQPLGQPLAERYFAQGMAFLAAGELGEARRSLDAAAVLAPAEPAPHWARALAHGAGPDAAASEFVHAALLQASEVAHAGTPFDRDMVQALTELHDPALAGGPGAFAGFRRLLAAHPADGAAPLWFAHALLGASAGDALAEEEAAGLLASVGDAPFARCGALHLRAHLLDVGGKVPEVAVVAGEMLATIDFSVHCATLSARDWSAIGEHERAVEAWREAARVHERHVALCRKQGFAPAADVADPLRGLWRALALEGRSSEAIAAARRLAAHAADGGAGEHDASAPLFALARFGRWREILDQPRPSAERLYVRAIDHYARGLARVHFGELFAADEELAALTEIAARGEFDQLEFTPGLSAARLLGIAVRVLGARRAQVVGDHERTLALLSEALALEDELSVRSPDPWSFPLRQALANSLVAAGRYAEAEHAYREELATSPANGWSLHGLEECLRWQGKGLEAQLVGEAEREAWRRADVRLGHFTNACAAATPFVPAGG